MMSQLTMPKMKIMATVAAMVFAGSAQATSLVDAFNLAQRNDPAYQAAKLEQKANEANAFVARTAYLPVANASVRRFEYEAATRRTFTISQPIFDLGKFATMREGKPRDVVAAATFRVREEDLAKRVLKTVAEYIKVRETIDLNKAQIEALTKQSERSKKSYELGQGTITEVRAAQVRLDQALAMERSLATQFSVAQKQYQTLMGQAIAQSEFPLTQQPLMPKLPSLDALLESVHASNAQVLLSRANERLADLASQRANAGFMPQVNLVHTQSQLGDAPRTNYTGINMELPLGLSVQNFASKYQAGLNADAKIQERIDVEQKTRLEMERLWALVTSGMDELKYRKDAIASAELSREAYEKSFQGGVVSAVDVLNSILTVYQVKSEYLTALIGFSEQLLNLQMMAAEEPMVALERVQLALLNLGPSSSVNVVPVPSSNPPKESSVPEVR